MSDHERIEFLTARVAELENKFESAARFERWARVLTAIGASVVFVFGILEYVDTKNDEFHRTFWQERVDLYSQACNAAANIASASDINLVKTDRDTFWSLYWGKLSIVEDENVKVAMENYGSNLWTAEHYNGTASDLRPCSYALAWACRESLGNTWKPISLGHIDQTTENFKSATESGGKQATGKATQNQRASAAYPGKLDLGTKLQPPSPPSPGDQ